MSRFLLVSAILEVPAGVAFVLTPLLQAGMCFGTTLDGPGGTALARLLGCAMVALGLACWCARRDGSSRAARGLAAAMLFYNASVVVLGLAGALVSRVSAPAQWPAAVIHAGMAVWCIWCLRDKEDTAAVAGSR